MMTKNLAHRVATRVSTLWSALALSTALMSGCGPHVTVNLPDDNTAPTVDLGGITTLTTPEDIAITGLVFTVGDAETLADLTVTWSSSDPSVIAPSGISVSGTGAARVLTITPVADAFGDVTLTVTVSDGTLSVTGTITVTVTPVPDAPTITDVADQSTLESTPTGAIAFVIGDVDTALADLVVSARSSDQLLVPDANLVLSGTGADRQLVATPVSGLAGVALITLTVSDGELTTEVSFLLTVTAVNDAPTITTVSPQMTPDGTMTGNLPFVVADAETPASSLVVTASSSNQALLPDVNITLMGTGNARTVSLSPVAGQTGVATITLTVSDGELSASSMFVLTVGGANTAPTVSAVADQMTDEDVATGAIAFTVGDGESGPADLSVSVLSNDVGLVPLANLVLGGADAARTLTITPAPNQNGSTLVTIAVSDGTATTYVSFTLTVNPVNDAPTITALADASTPEDTVLGPLTFMVADLETDAGSLNVTALSSDLGVVDLSGITLGGSGASRTVTLTPVAGASGPTTITLRVSDGDLAAEVMFTLTVTAVNDAPTLSAVADQVVDEDTSTGPLSITVDDPDNDAADLMLSATSSDTALFPPGSIVFGGTGASRTVEVTPALDASGSATITVTVTDGDLSAAITFMVTVTPVDDPPTISAIADLSIMEDTDTGALGFTIGDVDTALGDLVLTVNSSDLTLVPLSNIVLGGSGAARTVTVTPAAGETGSADISVTVADASSMVTETFLLTVTVINDPPTITAIADQTTDEDTATGAIAFTVDDDLTPLGSLTLMAASSSPSVVPVANIVFGGSGGNRTVVVTPAPDASGVSTVTITVSDGTGSADASFMLTVNAVDDAPVATDDTFTGASGTTGNVRLSVSGSVLANDTDVDTAAASLTAVAAMGSSTQGGDFVIMSDGTFIYDPPAGYLGSDTFDYQVTDGSGVDTGTVTISVGVPMRWFVDNEATGPGDGRDQSPFQALASVEGVTTATANDIVVLDYGDGTNAHQNVGVTLQAGMLLMGVPNMGGLLPVVSNAGGDGVVVGTGNSVSNVSIQGTGGNGIRGSVSGTTSISNVEMAAVQGVGIELNGGSAITITDADVSALLGGVRVFGAGALNVTGVVSVRASGGFGVDLTNVNVGGAGVHFADIEATNPMGRGVSLDAVNGTVELDVLTLTTTGGAGLFVANVGTVVSTGSMASTITSTNAPAVDATNVILGVDLLSASSTGGVRGLRLTDTTGNFRVLGDTNGAQGGSGGTLRDHTGAGVELTNVTGVELASMDILDAGDDGVFGRNVTGFLARGMRVEGAGDALGDHGMHFVDLAGVASLDDSVITGSAVDAFRVENTTGMLSLTISDSTLADSGATFGDSGLKVELGGSAMVSNLTVTGSTFSSLFSNGIIVAANDASTVTVRVEDTDFDDTNTAFNLGTSGRASARFDFVNNASVMNSFSHAVNVFTAPSSVSGGVRGSIVGNTIGQLGMAGSGSTTGHGIRVNVNGGASAVVDVTANAVFEVLAGAGIDARARDGAGGLDLTLAGNIVQVNPVTGLEGIRVLSSTGNFVCANISENNAMGGSPGAYSVGAAPTGTTVMQGFVMNVPATLVGLANIGMPMFQVGTVSASVGPCQTP